MRGRCHSNEDDEDTLAAVSNMVPSPVPPYMGSNTHSPIAPTPANLSKSLAHHHGMLDTPQALFLEPSNRGGDLYGIHSTPVTPALNFSAQRASDAIMQIPSSQALLMHQHHSVQQQVQGSYHGTVSSHSMMSMLNEANLQSVHIPPPPPVHHQHLQQLQQQQQQQHQLMNHSTPAPTLDANNNVSTYNDLRALQDRDSVSRMLTSQNMSNVVSGFGTPGSSTPSLTERLKLIKEGLAARRAVAPSSDLRGHHQYPNTDEQPARSLDFRRNNQLSKVRVAADPPSI
jgi:flagellar motor protein MotB